MNHLLRELAPIPAEAWEQIEDEAKRTLVTHLAARKLIEFRGPHGWQHHAVGVGRTRALPGDFTPGTRARVRQVQPLLELRAEFELARDELAAAARGADDPDLDAVTEAAKRLGSAEDLLVFEGSDEAHVRGLMRAAEHAPLPIGDDYTAYPALVTEAMGRLRRAGVSGPYAIALGPRCFAGVHQTTTGAGYPVIRHVEGLLDGPVVWAPAMDGAAVLSLRGGDFELIVGQDVSIGYLDHDAERVRLYLEESVTFRLLDPTAVVPLRYAG